MLASADSGMGRYSACRNREGPCTLAKRTEAPRRFSRGRIPAEMLRANGKRPLPDFILVGAGIVGTSMAYALATRGASVTLIDSCLPGSGVTGDSFAWIGDSGLIEGPTAALQRKSIQDYRRFAAELPDVEINWSGSLLWGPGRPSQVGSELGPGQQLLDAADLAAIEPNLLEPPASRLDHHSIRQ